MTPVELKARTKKFAVDVIRFAKSIPRDHINDEIASPLTDAATSTAAYYRASCRARSRADFINKLAGGIEEVDEAALWLEVLAESGICAASFTTPLWREADELTRIFVRSRETAIANQQSLINQRSRIDNHQRFNNQRSTSQQSAGHLFGIFCFNSSVQLRTTLNVDSAEPCSAVGSLIARNR